MSRRNPMNERYQQTEEQKASTGAKRAASAKPKSKAASSVHVDTGKKTPQQKKAAAKERDRGLLAEEREYQNPPTQRYKNLSRAWIVCLVLAIACTVGVWLLQGRIPDTLLYIMLGLSYVLIIAALYIDLSLRRKERRRYRAMVESQKQKEKTLAKSSSRKIVGEEAAAPAATEEKKPGFFARTFGKKKEA